MFNMKKKNNKIKLESDDAVASKLGSGPTVVLACSGPSLNKINPFSLGYPVVVISTAIRADAFKGKENAPMAWVLADMPMSRRRYKAKNGQFLLTPQAKQHWKNSKVLKVLPIQRKRQMFPRTRKSSKQFFFCGYDVKSSQQKRKRRDVKEVFNGKMPFLRGPSKSVTLALQWCHYVGIKNIIIAGCDLSAPSIGNKYAYDIEDKDTIKRCNQDQLDCVKTTLRRWYPVAKKYRFNWYNWESGPILGSIIPPLPESIINYLQGELSE